MCSVTPKSQLRLEPTRNHNVNKRTTSLRALTMTDDDITDNGDTLVHI